MIQLQLKPETEAWLATEADRRGLAPEAYVSELVESARRKRGQWIRFGTPKYSPAEAADSILEIQKRNTLGGLSIKDLIHEGHKY
jgi:hypothetical protein